MIELKLDIQVECDIMHHTLELIFVRFLDFSYTPKSRREEKKIIIEWLTEKEVKKMMSENIVGSFFEHFPRRAQK